MSVEVLQLPAVCKWNDTDIEVISVGSHPDPVKIRFSALLLSPSQSLSTSMLAMYVQAR
jgi:hypothetical protein